MVDKKNIPFYLVLGLVLSVYVSQCFGIKRLAADYHEIKPELEIWYQQTTASEWYGYQAITEDGFTLNRWPRVWDCVIELIILVSGGLLFLTMRNIEGRRNVTIILRSVAVSFSLCIAGVFVESLDSSSTIAPLNSPLIMLGLLHLAGRLILMTPFQRLPYLLSLSMICFLSHWAIMEYGFAIEKDMSVTGDNGEVQVAQELSVWDDPGGIQRRFTNILTRVLPMSIKRDGISNEYAHYSEINLISYFGLLCLGMASAAIHESSVGRVRCGLQLCTLGVLFLILSLAMHLLGIPVVPSLASPPHALLVSGFAYVMLSLAIVISQSTKLVWCSTPLIAVGSSSALIYVVERTLGMAVRAEVTKHLEPVFQPLFGDAWIKWEPLVFFNLVFLGLLAGALYLYRKRVSWTL